MIRLGAGALVLEGDRGSLIAALALSAATGRAFIWEGFRPRAGGIDEAGAGFARFVAEVSGGRLLGGGPGDTDIGLEPGTLVAGSYRLELPGAEPAMPFLRAALLPLGRAPGVSTLVVRGATHAPGGETFEPTQSTFLALLEQVGLGVHARLESAGFAPRGGGVCTTEIADATVWKATALESREPLRAIRIVSAGASLPAHVQQRQAARARSGVQIAGVEPSVQLLKLRSQGAGSVVAVSGIFGTLPVTTASVSERGKSAEAVGEEASAAFRRFLNQKAVVPGPLVEAFVLFLAFARGSSVLTTPHLMPAVLRSARLVQAFTGRDVTVEGRVGRPARLRVEDFQLQTGDGGSILKAT